MARRLKEFPRSAAIAGKYPWEEWMNGDVWRVGPADKICLSFRTMLYMKARDNGMRVKASLKEEDVIFQFFKKKKEAAVKKRRR